MITSHHTSPPLFSGRAARVIQAILVSTALGGIGCKTLPDVNLATKEPLKVDINVRLDVYQYGEKDKDKGTKASSTKSADDTETVLKRHMDRMEEIQKVKNGRFVGEDHQGLLAIRDLPADSYGTYIKKAVEDENADRLLLMKATAAKENLALHEVQSRAWKLAVEKAFVDEWIEVPAEKEGLYRWEQKK